MGKPYPLIIDIFLSLLHPFAFNLLELIAYNNSISTIKPSGMDLELAIGKHHGWKGITPCRD